LSVNERGVLLGFALAVLGFLVSCVALFDPGVVLLLIVFAHALQSLLFGRGCLFAETPPGYLMRLIRQIEVALSGADARLADPKRWAYGLAEHEVMK